MNIGTIVIPNSFFLDMESFLNKSIHKIQSENILSQDIEIFMPEYFVRMYQIFVQQERYLSFWEGDDKKRFMGILIYPNYENSIVVSHKHILLRKDDEPNRLLIPNTENGDGVKMSVMSTT